MTHNIPILVNSFQIFSSFPSLNILLSRLSQVLYFFYTNTRIILSIDTFFLLQISFFIKIITTSLKIVDKFKIQRNLSKNGHHRCKNLCPQRCPLLLDLNCPWNELIVYQSISVLYLSHRTVCFRLCPS